MTKNKKQKLNLILNNIDKDINDHTLVKTSMIILDFTRSHNNVIVKEEETETLRKTIKNKPIVCKYIPVSEANAQDDSFTSHNEFLSENKYGEMFVDRDTIAIGVFTSEGYIADVEVDGEMRRVLMADGVLWYSKYPDAVDLLLEWHSRGININMSCEYLYSNYSFIDGVEYHQEPLYLEAHAILNSENRNGIDVVTPAYESATIISINEMKEFNRLVASAINQNKEVNDLEENLQTNEEVNTENPVEETPESTEEETVVETQADEVVEESTAETENEQVVQLNAKVEELTETITQLNNKIEELTTSKLELVEKFDSATETITQLNSRLEELKPLKEQIELAQKEAELNEAKETFETKFNSVDASELFGTEEIQTLVAQSIEVGEVGLNAKLSLNEKIVELASKKIEANINPIQSIMNTVSKRDFKDLISNDNDPLSEYRS